MTRNPYSFAILGFVLCGLAVGQEDGTRGKLLAARADYEKAVEKSRGGLVAELRKKADAAQKAGDLKTLEAVEGETRAFEVKGALPKSVPTKTYEADVRKARAKLEDAYATAVKEYTKAGQRAQAKAAQQELDEFKKAGASDPAVKGSTPAVGADGWAQLFNGKDLAGWRSGGNPRGVWKVDAGGVLVGTTPTPATYLLTAKTDYKNFHVRVTTMMSEGLNSGVNFGDYRVFIAGTAAGETGKTGDLYKGADLLVDAPEVRVKPGEWFTQEVIVRGKQISVLVNGKSVLKYEEKAGPLPPAPLALMCRGESTVRFKKVEVKELPDE